MSSPTYRYQLLPYGGPATRRACPACSPKHHRTLVPYLDTRTGEVLPAEYGRCNREVECGYHHSPYHVDAGGLSYRERQYQQEQPLGTPFVRARGRSAVAQRTPPPPISCLPAELLEQSMTGYEKNAFARLLTQHFGAGVATELLQRFQIGTSAYWSGACVFWLVDELQRVRGGQVVQFDAAGHTVKAPQPDGTTKRRTSWVHTALQRTYERRRQPVPDWLTAYCTQPQKSPCLFGLPQLTTAPADQPVALVEAPKTAVLCTPYFPDFVWLAVGALSYLNAARLAPLRGRSIVLFPDAAEGGRAYAEWSQRAEQLRREGFRIDVSDLLEQTSTDAQRRAGIDLADLLLEQWAGYPPSWDTPADEAAAPTTTPHFTC